MATTKNMLLDTQTLSQLLEPGVKELLFAKIERDLKEELARSLEEHLKDLTASVMAAIESYESLADRRLVVNITLNSRPLEDLLREARNPQET